MRLCESGERCFELLTLLPALYPLIITSIFSASVSKPTREPTWVEISEIYWIAT